MPTLRSWCSVKRNEIRFSKQLAECNHLCNNLAFPKSKYGSPYFSLVCQVKLIEELTYHELLSSLRAIHASIRKSESRVTYHKFTDFLRS